MVAATLTSKGQITIPKPVRDSLRLRTGDRVEFVVRGTDEAVLRSVTRSVDEVYGRMARPGQKPVPVEAMNAAVARRARSRAP